MPRISLVRLVAVALILVSSPNAQNLLDGPEGIVFDSVYNRYLVSCISTGSVIAIDLEGNQSLFAQFYGGWNSARMVLGNCISGDRFYTVHGAGPAKIASVNLATGNTEWEVTVEETKIICGIAADTSGYLYGAHSKGATLDCIYRLDLNTKVWDTFVCSGLPGAPSGIVFDAVHNRLLAVGLQDLAPIVSISLPGGAVSDFSTASPGGFEGITIDRDGYVYTSQFSYGRIFRWEPDGSSCVVISSGHRGLALLDYNWRDEILAVPNYAGASISYIPLADPDDDDVAWHLDNCPEIWNVDQDDPDADDLGTACDNCPEDFNPGQDDADSDGIGDICESCCSLRVGDANSLGGDEPTIGDVSAMIDAKFIGGTCTDVIGCLAEADVNLSGSANPTCEDITIGDISILIDYLFITGPSLALPECF